MTKSLQWGACLILLAGALMNSAPDAQARGALAVGECGAWGGSWDYGNERGARDRALDECRGRRCKIVTTFRGLCAAFAYDSSKSCGAWGWATRNSRSQARSAAVEQCEDAGGRNCEVRAQFCDED